MTSKVRVVSRMTRYSFIKYVFLVSYFKLAMMIIFNISSIYKTEVTSFEVPIILG
jgi:hypothetical protein